MSRSADIDSTGSIAIIGMGGRFPKAKNLKELWENLCNGIEAISFFSVEDAIAAGEDPALARHPNYVTASGLMDDIDLFDATLFGFNPREAEVMDPQQRIFLECAWEALEDAACNPDGFPGRIGVFAGIGENQYLASMPADYRATTDGMTLGIGNEKDYVATRVSYKANLTGPGITIQSACSTSLVTVSLACQSLLNFQSDVALAGGVSIDLHKKGRIYVEGGILSPDGHCRSFDASAKGTIWGSGAGVVVLKRLEDAIDNGDHIYAVIKATAVNNDGAVKIGYTAPSKEGQAAVITEALELANVNPESISYVEAHGTGTQLGDPIEVAALTKAYRYYTDKKGFCRIGSIKTNIGHTDSAAGIAGLIKTVLSLHHKKIPPSLHYERPNPQIDFENSPFFVNTGLVDWPEQNGPRRAGVSSFGIGGTNAHIIVEEAPPRSPAQESSRSWQLLPISARTDSALETTAARLADYLEANPSVELADAAFTLQEGRKEFEYRRAFTCRDREDAIRILRGSSMDRVSEGRIEFEKRPVVFMFPGQGTQYAGMGRGLYQTEPLFRQLVDYCCDLLRPELELDLREVLFPAAQREQWAGDLLKETRITQPALFVIEYALARLWMEWGVKPSAMIGHSIGEYVAATIAEVLSLDDALRLVATRGKLVQAMDTGAMLAVPMTEAEIKPLIGAGLSLAAVNAPSLCVVAGSYEDLARLELALNEKGIPGRRLHTSHAFHSRMMDPAAEQFSKFVRQVRLGGPRIPYLSNLTGTWIREEQATDPSYWAAHLRESVRFSEGVQVLLEDPARLYLEVGPGKTLLTFARQHATAERSVSVVASMRHPQEEVSDSEVMYIAAGQIWTLGGAMQWNALHNGEQRLRLPLPPYPFERQRFWVEGGTYRPDSRFPGLSPGKQTDLADWFWAPSWKREQQLANPEAMATGQDKENRAWLVFLDSSNIGSALVQMLEANGEVCRTVSPGEHFSAHSETAFSIRPAKEEDFQALLERLPSLGQRTLHIVNFWPLMPAGSLEEAKDRDFFGLISLCKALGSRGDIKQSKLMIVSDGLHDVTGDEALQIEKSLLLGPYRVIPKEYANIDCRSIDIELSRAAENPRAILLQLIAELSGSPPEGAVALRGRHRWIQTFEPLRLDENREASLKLREAGVYLITGGMGGIGLELASVLAESPQVKIALLGRSAFPDQAQWEQWIQLHGPEDPVSRKIHSLRALERAGAELLLVRADVSDRSQMEQAIEQVERSFGAINGVIHAAGLPAGGLIQLKTAENVEPILAPKVQGTLVLDSLLAEKELDFFIVCSSIASVFGVAGQVDYCAANAFLDGFAQRKARNPGTQVLSINWDAWAEVGMAVNAAKIWPVGAKVKTGYPENAVQSTHPLFDRQILADEESTFFTEFSAAKHWVIGEHIVMGNPTLVGTGWIEMARAACESKARKGAIEISDIIFIQPLSLHNGDKKNVRTILHRNGSGYEFAIRSTEALSENAEEIWLDHVVGKVASVESGPPEVIDLQKIIQARGLKPVVRTAGTDGLAVANGNSLHLEMTFGDRWSRVEPEVFLGANEALALLELPAEFSGDLNAFPLHPSLMDIATSYILTYLEGGMDYLPFSYKRIRVFAPLKRKIYCHSRCRDASSPDEVMKFDVTIYDEEGTRLVDVEEVTFRKLGQHTLKALQSRENERLPQTHGDQAAVAADLSEAILSREGGEVFRRLLRHRISPQMVVSTRNFYSLTVQNGTAETAGTQVGSNNSGPKKKLHPRPNLRTPFAEPQTQLEEAIAEIWQTVLGIEKVGAQDDFIELGGHSLLAIQVISRLRDMFQVSLPMDALFKAPTIAKLSETVVRLFAEQTDHETLAQMIAEIEQLTGAEPA